MITLKTLPEATEQQVFDQCAAHLLKQNEKSHDPTKRCRYRYEGLARPTGCLISDEEYGTGMEGVSWKDLVFLGMVPPEHQFLIQGLQKIHDAVSVGRWPACLGMVAKEYKLDSSVIKNFI